MDLFIVFYYILLMIYESYCLTSRLTPAEPAAFLRPFARTRLDDINISTNKMK